MSEIFLHSIFADNLALVYFLGMCTFLGTTPSMATALGVGTNVILVLSITVPLNHLAQSALIAPGAWSGFPDMDLTFLRLFLFVGILAATIQILGLTLRHFAPAQHRILGTHLPIVLVNGALLGGSLFMAERGYDLPESVVYGLGSGIGWTLAIATFAAMRERLRYNDMPEGLEGAPSGFFIAGLLSMGFLALATAMP